VHYTALFNLEVPLMDKVSRPGGGKFSRKMPGGDRLIERQSKQQI
jgi:hypothetical protein